MDEKIKEAFNELAELFSDYDLHNQPLMKSQVLDILEKMKD